MFVLSSRRTTGARWWKLLWGTWGMFPREIYFIFAWNGQGYSPQVPGSAVPAFAPLEKKIRVILPGGSGNKNRKIRSKQPEVPKKAKRGWAFQSHVLHRREYFESKIASCDWLLLWSVWRQPLADCSLASKKKIRGTFTTEFSAESSKISAILGSGRDDTFTRARDTIYCKFCSDISVIHLFRALRQCRLALDTLLLYLCMTVRAR